MPTFTVVPAGGTPRHTDVADAIAILQAGGTLSDPADIEALGAAYLATPDRWRRAIAKRAGELPRIGGVDEAAQWRELYHATSPAIADTIVADGFDPTANAAGIISQAGALGYVFLTDVAAPEDWTLRTGAAVAVSVPPWVTLRSIRAGRLSSSVHDTRRLRTPDFSVYAVHKSVVNSWPRALVA